MPDNPAASAFSALLTSMENGSPPQEFELCLEEAVRAGAVASAVAASARRVNNVLWETRRKERLVRMLYDIATDLTGLRDFDAILSAIVRRTRTLIGSDMAYLSLNDDENNETYIRMTDGVVTPAYRNIRMPIGFGILGAVAVGDAPAQTSDYLADARLSRLPEVDRAVEGEGVKSIVGVPLRAEGRVVGVLLVANRRPHIFSSEDVSLMETIGSNAAVVLENARLFAKTTEALERSAELQRQNEEHVRALEGIASSDKRLMEAIISPPGIERFVELLSETLGAAVAVVDPLGVAACQSPPLSGPALVDAVEESAARRLPVSLVVDDEFTVMAAMAGEQVLGALVVAGTLDSSQLLVLERSSLVLSVGLLIERSSAEAEERLQFELIDDLMSDRRKDSAALGRRAAQLGFGEDVPLIVHVIDVEQGLRQRALEALRRAPGRTGITAAHEGHLCVIERLTRDEESAGHELLQTLRAYRIDATIGSSSETRGLSTLPGAHAEAHDVLNALLALTRRGESATSASLGTSGLLLRSVSSAFADRLVRMNIGAVLDYDARRGTELALTAWTYLELGGTLTPAAHRLHIHPNTLRQRIGRIDTLLGPGWRQGGRSLDVHVALRLWKLRESSHQR